MTYDSNEFDDADDFAGDEEIDFTDVEITVTSVVNAEQLKHLALSVLSNVAEDTELGGIATSLLSWYLMQDAQKKGETFTVDSLTEKHFELVVEHAAASLVQKGLMNPPEDGSSIYTPTELGEEVKLGKEVADRLLLEMDEEEDKVDDEE